jgi:DNA-binding FrmR family transcriptional regulator
MASYVKAMSYAMLDKYQECRDILTQYGDLKSELENIKTLEGNRKGEYKSEHSDTYRYD